MDSSKPKSKPSQPPQSDALEEWEEKDGKWVTREKFTCVDCALEFEVERTADESVAILRLFKRCRCDKCDHALAEKQAAEDLARDLAARKAGWSRICPPLYLATDIERLPRKEAAQMDQWQDNGDGIGIGLCGPSGTCKTRLLFELGRQLFMEGNSVAAIGSVEFSRICVDLYSDDHETQSEAKRRMRQIRGADYLILDDIGKGRLTDSREAEFYGLIETRTAHLRPTFWSTNLSAKGLREMLSGDRGEPIVRRLIEFSKIIKFEGVRALEL